MAQCGHDICAKLHECRMLDNPKQVAFHAVSHTGEETLFYEDFMTLNEIPDKVRLIRKNSPCVRIVVDIAL